MGRVCSIFSSQTHSCLSQAHTFKSSRSSSLPVLPFCTTSISSIPISSPKTFFWSITTTKRSHITVRYHRHRQPLVARLDTVGCSSTPKSGLSISGRQLSTTNIILQSYQHAITGRQRSFSTLAGASPATFGVSAVSWLSFSLAMPSSRLTTTLSIWP